LIPELNTVQQYLEKVLFLIQKKEFSLCRNIFGAYISL